MDITNLITEIQALAKNSTTPLELMTLAKSIEKLGVGKVGVVTNVGQLPTTSIEGDIYIVEDDFLAYYYANGTWNTFPIYNIAYAWGDNGNGSLGDNSTVAKSSPVTVLGGITNWSQISGGTSHSLGVTDTGIAYAWGYNATGGLGDNSTINKSSPVTVVGGITNWSQMSGGRFCSLGIAGGIAYAWGRGATGELGDGTTVDKSSPVTIIGGITNWSQVSAGFSHSLGLTDTGIAYAWGNSGFGRLGDGTIVARSSPVTVVGGLTWSQISAGSLHSLGVTDNGIAYAWGSNSNGQLGTGTVVSSRTPITVVGGITNWSQVSAGGSLGLGITSSGNLYAWGYGNAGRLGDGTTVNKSSPVLVAGGITNWSQVSNGPSGAFTLALTKTGTLYAWGSNTSGQVGDGTTVNKSSPVTVAGGITNWSQVGPGDNHSLATTIV